MFLGPSIQRAQVQLNPSPGIPMTPKTARNSVMAMAFLGASFAGLYYALKERDRRKREAGRIEQYELTLEQAKRGGQQFPLRLNNSESQSIKDHLLPVREHDAKHMSMPTAKSKGFIYGEGQRIEQPAPQPQKSDGSGAVVSKRV